MTRKQLLLTGASGFLGSAISLELHEIGFKVTGVSRIPHKSNKIINWLQGDITNPEFVARALNGFEVVVNASGKTGNSKYEGNRKEYFQINCDAAKVLAKTAHLGGVKRFIHISSTGVFGPGTGVYGEDSKCDPGNHYEQSKLAGEDAVCAEASDRMPVTVVRPTNVFGERHPGNKLLTWFRSLKKGYVVLAKSPKRSWVNYVYVGDVARVIARLADTSENSDDGRHAAVYIVNTPATMQEFFDASVEALGGATRAFVVPRRLLSMMATFLDVLSFFTRRQFPLNSDKVRELSNQQIFISQGLKIIQPGFPYVGLSEGLSRTCAYYIAQELL
jgi:nucleoside-diphosphate-sugar epimerase